MSKWYGGRDSGTGCATSASILVFLTISLSLSAGSAFADAPYPGYGTRIVDGDVSDWNLAKDYFATMYRAGEEGKPLESWLYLRYDCNTNTLYVLVRGRPSVPVVVSEDEAWVALGSINTKLVDGYSGADGVPPDFAWVDVAPAPGDSVAAGFEASIPLLPGSYKLIVHVNVWDDNEEQTSATAGFTNDGILVIVDCAVPVEELSWGRIKTLYR